MCIIVDANRLGKFISKATSVDAEPIHRWLARGGQLVYSEGGKFAKELGAKARAALAGYAQAGMARRVPTERFVADEEALRTSGRLRSDDPHVLALARESGARVLYTGDEKLMADFKDASVIKNPRGKVYKTAANASLLTRSTCSRDA